MRRRLFVILGLIAAATTTASAADYETPVLRGSDDYVPVAPAPAYIPQWSGLYAGVQFGYSNASMGFGTGVSDLAAYVVRDTVLESVVGNMTTLQKVDTTGSSFGGYFGYNSRWESLVLGFEVNYSHSSFEGVSADSVSVLYKNDAGAPSGHHFFYDPLTVAGSASIRITDLATFRARAGWTVGQFMPYAFVGAAVARADVTRSATVSYTRIDTPDVQTPPTPQLNPIPTAFFSQTDSDVKNGGFYLGYSAGIGLEVEILPRVIARGEWEFVDLPSVKNTGVAINSVRAGVGLKF